MYPWPTSIDGILGFCDQEFHEFADSKSNAMKMLKRRWIPKMMKSSFLSDDSDNTSVTYMKTCPLDSTLQLLYMLWKRGSLLDEMFCDPVVFLSLLKH